MPPLIVPSQSSDVSRCWMHNFLWVLIDFVPALALSMLCLLAFCLGFSPAPEIRWNPGRIAELIFWWQLSNNGAQELMGKCFFFLSFRQITQGSCLHGSQEAAETERLRCIQKLPLYWLFLHTCHTLLVPWDYHQSQLLAFSTVYQTLLWKTRTKLRRGPQHNLFLCSQVPEPTSITELSAEISLSVRFPLFILKL